MYISKGVGNPYHARGAAACMRVPSPSPAEGLVSGVLNRAEPQVSFDSIFMDSKLRYSSNTLVVSHEMSE